MTDKPNLQMGSVTPASGQAYELKTALELANARADTWKAMAGRLAKLLDKNARHHFGVDELLADFDALKASDEKSRSG